MKWTGLVLLSFCACAGVGTPVTPANRDGAPSEMLPAARAQDLLYVSDEGANDVDVYAYPAGTHAGKLTNLAQPAGLCTDTLGDVWVVQSSSAKITEFGHGGAKPIATLTISGARRLLGCAVDPTTGNLAVTDLGNSKGGGSLWVFARAQGTPKNYRDPKISFAYFDGYDLEGNLFVDGLGTNARFELAELPKGAGSLKDISLYKSVGFPGGVRWDGEYVAIGDQDYQGRQTSAIYQISVFGSRARVEGTTPLTGSCDVAQFTFGRTGAKKAGQKNQVVGADICQNTVGFYQYPAGGSATKTLNGFQYPLAVTLSLAK